jgi:hypothetical protein
MAAGSRWETSIAGINTYVAGLPADAIVTVAVFDTAGALSGFAQPFPGTLLTSQTGRRSTTAFEVVRESVAAGSFVAIGYEEVKPRGGTPLYDATAKLLNIADAAAPKKAVIMIVTDGEENESKVYNLESIKDRIATCKGRGWEVVFLGAEFNADNVARSYGLTGDKVINTTLRNMDTSMSYFSANATAYASGKSINTSPDKARMAIDE